MSESEWRERALIAEATVERVKNAIAGHPACDKHGPDDVIKCGWKRAVADVTEAVSSET